MDERNSGEPEMDWQLIAVIGLVIGSAVYLARATWQTWTSASPNAGGCGSGCGKCSAGPVPEPTASQRIRLPQV
jgi:hypothetical protein